MRPIGKRKHTIEEDDLEEWSREILVALLLKKPPQKRKVA
jgi:hypothetical protein